MDKFHCAGIRLKPYSIKLLMLINLPRKFSNNRLITIFITLVMTAGLPTSVFGQIKAAKTEMAQYNYPKAIEILHQFIQKADPKTKLEATLLMADCYRLQNDMQDARSWYFKALKMGNNEPLTYFYYAKALRACGEYETAKKIFLRYDSLMPDDHRGKIYASFCDSAMAWDEKPFAFEVNNARTLNSANSEFGPVFYNNGVVFTTDRVMSADEEKKSGWAGHGYLKMMFATPKQTDDYYGDYNLPKLIPELNESGSNYGPATFTKDGNEVFITRTIKSTDKTKDETEEGQSNQLKIYSANKIGDKWSKLKPFFFNSSKYSVGYPALSPDGNSLYFVSDIEGGYGGTDLYVTNREGGNWSSPSNLGPIVNTFGDETFPFMADNGDLYFASDGHPGYGGLDIFVTRKVGDIWLIPQNLGRPINSSYDDFALAMYKNDSVGLFSANRPGGRGEDDIYTFRVVGPLPALASPAIAAVQNPVQQPKTRPEVTKEQKQPPQTENVVPVPAPAITEVTPQQQQQTAEIKPEVTKTEVQTAPSEEQKPSAQPENVVPSPASVTAEVKQQAEKQPVEVKPAATQPEEKPAITAEQKPPAQPENVVPSPAPATTEGKPQPENIVPSPAPATTEGKPQPENIVPSPASATAEIKPQPEKQLGEVKPAVTQPEEKPAITTEQKPPAQPENVVPSPAQPENVVPSPAPATAEAKPQPEKQPVEVKPAVTQPEEKPAITTEQKPPAQPENVVPSPAPATAEVKPQPEKQPVEVKPAATQPEEKPAITTEQKPPAQPENVVPSPAPATAEAKPQPEKQPVEVKPAVTQPAEKPAITEEQKPPVTAEQNPPAKAENIVPVPVPATAETKQQEITKEQNVITAENTAAKVMVSGCIKDGTTHEAIPAATVFFLNEANGKVFVHKANATGCFRSELSTGINYTVKAMQTGYSSDCLPFSSGISGNLAETGTLNDLLLEKPGVIRTYKIENIYYDFDRYFIRPDAEPALNKLIRIMKEVPATVELGSHADCRGSDTYNMILTERRAASAVQYIVQRGIDGSRITSHWYGKSRLTNNCNCAEGVHCTESQHQANRRTEFTISVPEATAKETAINLEKFREGDTLDIRLLPAGFFENCNHNLISGILAGLLNSSVQLPQAENRGVLYTVQIGAFSYITPHFNDLNDVMSCKGPDGILRCFVGKFTSKTEAIWYRDHLRTREFKDAFVTQMDEKHKPSGPKEMACLNQK